MSGMIRQRCYYTGCGGAAKVGHPDCERGRPEGEAKTPPQATRRAGALSLAIILHTLSLPSMTHNDVSCGFAAIPAPCLIFSSVSCIMLFCSTVFREALQRPQYICINQEYHPVLLTLGYCLRLTV